MSSSTLFRTGSHAFLALTLGLPLLLLAPGCGAAESDQALASAVRERLIDNPGVEGLIVDVQVKDGVVTLQGRATNVGAKSEAKTQAEDVPGVRRVVDDIEVDVPTEPSSQLEQDIDKALKRHSLDKSGDVDVAVQDELITLTGSADSERKKRQVGRVVSHVDGVAAVDNEIQVDRARANSDLADQVRQSLAEDKQLHEDHIHVSVDRGVVRLSGKVGSVNQKARAAHEAWVAGVRQVDSNRLRVHAETSE